MTRSISKRASMRFTASSAIGEITTAFLPRRALVAMSASSKDRRLAAPNERRRDRALRTRRLKLVVATVGIGLEDAAEAVR